MNVTILVAQSLQNAVEGRAEIQLGLPANAGLGDVFEVLLKLYPRLKGKLVNERKPSPGIQFFVGSTGTDARLYLLATLPKHSKPEG